MYPVIPVGPLSLPTAPILALVAVWLGLDVTARFGRRYGLDSDELWNFGLLALIAGLIVARLWHVVQFWPIYRQDPLLMFSIRPGGLAFWPGVVAGLLAGYAYLLWRRLDPVQVAAALSVGLLAVGAVLSVSAFLTGSVIGTPTTGPWGLPYFGELRHPVGLYRALGLLVALAAVWRGADPRRPGRTILQAGLGYSLVRLFADAFQADPGLVGQVRASQLLALIAGVIFALLLARGEHSEDGQTLQPAD